MWSCEPVKATCRADRGSRRGAPGLYHGGLFEPFVETGPDLLGGQLGPLPLFLSDDYTGGRDTGDAGETENLPEVHDQETLL
jgi:hypothetical protein